jgi:hypothetical protein
LGHIIEEVGEARKYFPRKSWKAKEPDFTKDKSLREEYITELVDIHIFLENFALHYYPPDYDINFDLLYFDIQPGETHPTNFVYLVELFNSLIRVLIQEHPHLAFMIFSNILLESGISGLEFFEYYQRKISHNEKREDHKLGVNYGN